MAQTDELEAQELKIRERFFWIGYRLGLEDRKAQGKEAN